MKLTRDEQETVIRSSAADREWDIVTADGRVKTKLRRAGYHPTADHQLSDPYLKYTIPFAKVSIRRAGKGRSPVKPFQKRESTQQNETKTESHV